MEIIFPEILNRPNSIKKMPVKIMAISSNRNEFSAEPVAVEIVPAKTANVLTQIPAGPSTIGIL